ncbi:MAG TPA: aminotransferase class V-fold PLP-dependent enzyme, partial [Chloroflexota bacterium]|nr:aminotransferase class V-fold PLP-dependent enzyme [Chloroflexota bacterium]
AMPYESLGIRRVINAEGTKTYLGGSIMPSEVLEAMHQAAGWFVELPELHRGAGERIAALIGSPQIEDAAIVCGAAAGLAIATAACLAGTDPKKIRALPHLDWPDAKDQVVIPKTHVTGFAQSYRLAGPRLVEIGGAEGPTPQEVADAISERTVAVTLCGGELPGNVRFPSRASLAEIVQIAHARGVPVIVDAAAELPPPENLRRFNELGADLVVFSGGKGLCGPQASGLVLGKADLIEACRQNNNPNSSIGRPMKVGKEEIAGLLKAVDLYVNRDHAADLRRWDEDARTVLDALKGLEGVVTERVLARTIPQAKITVDADRAGVTAAAIATSLRKGEPSIFLTQSGDTLTVNPHNLQPGESESIATRLRSLLQAQARRGNFVGSASA